MLTDAFLDGLLEWEDASAGEHRYQVLSSLTSLSIENTHITAQAVTKFLREKQGIQEFVRFDIPPNYIPGGSGEAAEEEEEEEGEEEDEAEEAEEDDEADAEEEQADPGSRQWIDVIKLCLATCPRLTRLPYNLLDHNILQSIALSGGEDLPHDSRGEKDTSARPQPSIQRRPLRFPLFKHLQELQIDTGLSSQDDLSELIASCPSLARFTIESTVQDEYLSADGLALALSSLTGLEELSLGMVDLSAPSSTTSRRPRLPFCLPGATSEFTGVSKLVVSSSRLLFAALGTLTQLPQLKVLMLEHNKFLLPPGDSVDGGHASVKSISQTWNSTVAALPKLRVLEWYSCSLKPQCVMRLDIKHPKLARLRWYASDSDETTELWGLECPRLRTLYLSNNLCFGLDVTLSSLVATTPLLEKLQLHNLVLDGPGHSAELLHQITSAGLPLLRRLYFDTPVRKDRLSEVTTACSTLQWLSLADITATNDSMKRVLEGCSRLERLSLASVSGVTQLDDVSHPAIATVQLMNMPDLSGTLTLNGMVNLVHLLLWDTPNVTKLEVVGRPECDEVSVNQCNSLTDVEIRDNPRLVSLELYHNRSMKRLAVVAHGLHTLGVEHSPQLTAIAPFDCPEAATIRLAALPQAPLRVFIPRVLSHCPVLRSLEVSNCGAISVAKLKRALRNRATKGSTTHQPLKVTLVAADDSPPVILNWGGADV